MRKVDLRSVIYAVTGSGRTGQTRMLVIVLYAVCAVLVGCHSSRDNEEIKVDSELLRDLSVLSGKRVYFGHRSVGDNIVQGIEELVAEAASPVRVVRLEEPASPEGSGVFHSFIAKNREPFKKCDAFEKYVTVLAQETLDVAVMKFCYIDFNQDDTPEQMFEYYRKTIDGLRTTYPRTTFVHITTPLNTRRSLLKRIGRQLLGRNDQADLYAERRTKFNTMLLQEFAGEPMFDLAKLESTFPDGRRSSFEGPDGEVYTLRDDLTDDGGHLNEKGRRMAAREFIRIIAAVLRSPRSNP